MQPLIFSGPLLLHPLQHLTSSPPARPGLLSLGTVDLLEWAGQNIGSAAPGQDYGGTSGSFAGLRPTSRLIAQFSDLDARVACPRKADSCPAGST